MEIKGKVHCFFEQSGTFKNEFKKLGYEAYDYDIQNNFGETDFVIDIFSEIEKGYNNEPSIFDGFTNDDLILAFFPCIYFCGLSQVMMSWTAKNNLGIDGIDRMNKIIERSNKRTLFFNHLCKLIGICIERNIKIVIENPWEGQQYLRVFLKQPSYIDYNRMKRGDYMIKPTAYWFFNCEPLYGYTIQNDKKRLEPLKLKKGIERGICSEERSLISTDYARNFICDQILGITQKFPNQQLTLF